MRACWHAGPLPCWAPCTPPGPLATLPHPRPARPAQGRTGSTEDGGEANPWPFGTLRGQYWSELHVAGADAPFKVRGASYAADRVKVEAGAPEYRLQSVGGWRGRAVWRVWRVWGKGPEAAGGRPRQPICCAPAPACRACTHPPTHIRTRATTRHTRTRALPAPPALSPRPADLVNMGRPGLQHVARYLPSVRRSSAPFSFVVNLVVPGSPQLNLVITFASDKHPNSMGAPAADGAGWKPFDLLMHR